MRFPCGKSFLMEVRMRYRTMTYIEMTFCENTFILVIFSSIDFREMEWIKHNRYVVKKK